jgi:hypothetical protein
MQEGRCASSIPKSTRETINTFSLPLFHLLNLEPILRIKDCIGMEGQPILPNLNKNT